MLRWFKKKDGKFFAHYLMHDYAYSAHYNGANPPQLEDRMADFRATISAAMDDDVDEVLVVGHSSDAHLAVSILSDLIREGGVVKDNPALSFLSLGKVVFMVNFPPKADRLRADLHYLSTRDEQLGSMSQPLVTGVRSRCVILLPCLASHLRGKNGRW